MKPVNTGLVSPNCLYQSFTKIMSSVKPIFFLRAHKKKMAAKATRAVVVENKATPGVKANSEDKATEDNATGEDKVSSEVTNEDTIVAASKTNHNEDDDEVSVPKTHFYTKNRPFRHCMGTVHIDKTV